MIDFLKVSNDLAMLTQLVGANLREINVINITEYHEFCTLCFIWPEKTDEELFSTIVYWIKIIRAKIVTLKLTLMEYTLR